LSGIWQLDWQGLSPEWRLLLACVRRAIGSPLPEGGGALAGGAVNWAYWLELARWHRLDPLAIEGLRASEGWEAAPTELRRRLASLQRDNAVRALTLAGVLRDALRRLREAGVPAIALKGAPLALAAYGELGLRRSRDVDLLTPPEHLSQALAVLGEAGFCEETPLTAAQWSVHRRRFHEVKLRDGEALIELHWRCAHIPRMFPLALDPWPAEGAPLAVAGEPASVLRFPERVAYLCFHGHKHLWRRLFWICDLAALARRMPEADWGAAVARVAELKQRRAAALGFLLANRLFGAELPEPASALVARSPWAHQAARDWARWCFAEPAAGCAYRLTPSWPRVLLWTAASQDRLADKLHLFYQSLIPPNAADMRAFRLPSALFPLYYLLRPLRLLFKWLFGGRQED